MKTKQMLIRALLATTTLAVIGLSSLSVQADPPEKDNLPPGLRKKDKLPPGWQKKVGKSGETTATATNAAPSPVSAPPPGAVKAPETTATPPAPTATTKPAPPASVPEAKPSTTSGTTSAPRTPPTSLTKDQQERQARLVKLLGEFETAAVPQAATDRVIARLARFTDLTEAQLRERWKSQPGTTIGQFYLATVIAKNTGAKLDRVMADHLSGKSWGEVALARNLPIATLNEALVEATEAAHAGVRDAERKTQRAQTQ
jgi:hypothetical protein